MKNYAYLNTTYEDPNQECKERKKKLKHVLEVARAATPSETATATGNNNKNQNY